MKISGAVGGERERVGGGAHWGEMLKRVGRRYYDTISLSTCLLGKLFLGI